MTLDFEHNLSLLHWNQNDNHGDGISDKQEFQTKLNDIFKFLFLVDDILKI